MKNLKIKKIILPIATSLILMTTACNNGTIVSTKDTEIVTEETEEVTTNYELEDTKEETEIETPTEQEESFDNFNQEKEEINTLIKEGKLEEVKEKGTTFFINAIDFIFYDAEYKNVTFDELKEEAKKETFDNLCIIDGWIMNIFPDYKENLGEKWQIVKDFTSEKYYLALDTIKEYIGEENYNAIKNFKDNLKDNISNTWNNAKDKVKSKADSWYQNFKSEHEN